jgi:hypothetical protein
VQQEFHKEEDKGQRRLPKEGQPFRWVAVAAPTAADRLTTAPEWLVAPGSTVSWVRAMLYTVYSPYISVLQNTEISFDSFSEQILH